MVDDDPDTSELCRRILLGDLPSRNVLLARHRDRLGRMVASHIDRRLSSRVDPSDVVQDALAEADRRLLAYVEKRPIPFYQWLRRLAWEQLARVHEKHLYAQCRTVTRERGWPAQLSDESVMELGDRLAADGTSPSGNMIREERHRRLRAALDHLSFEDREVLIMRYLEQMSAREIAAELRIREGAVKSRCLRAVRRLHRLLEGDIKEP